MCRTSQDKVQRIGELQKSHQSKSQSILFASIEKHLDHLLRRLPATANPASSVADEKVSGTGCFGWAASVPVSYVTRIFKTVPYSHPDSAHLIVLAKLLRAGYLHREIREKGGAYGGLASCDIEGGLFSLLSYRDPHIIRTLGVYDDAAAWAAGGSFSDESIKEAQLSVFGDIDRPLSPGSRGIHEFANNRQGLTLEKRQKLRQQILATSRADLKRVAQQYLVDNSSKVDSIVANEEMLNQAKTELNDSSFVIKRI